MIQVLNLMTKSQQRLMSLIKISMISLQHALLIMQDSQKLSLFPILEIKQPTLLMFENSTSSGTISKHGVNLVSLTNMIQRRLKIVMKNGGWRSKTEMKERSMTKRRERD
jgi:hypothetical protein